VNATNPPLEQWQVDHIRKMKQELGMPQSAPYAEEVTMDGEDTETDMPTGGLDYAQSQRDYDLASQKVRDQIQSHIDVLEGARGKLRERRVGPSDSEKWLAIAAALGQPTRTGSFGESLGNVAQTLGAQKSARREAEEKRDLMLEKYGLDVGTERLRLLQSGATQAGQTLRAAMAAGKPKPSSWSENMSQFVSPDKPVATKNTVRVGNYNLTQYTDGSLRLRNPDGSYSVYTEDGVKVGDIPAGGVQ
jgi:hypothetical protein